VLFNRFVRVPGRPRPAIYIGKGAPAQGNCGIRFFDRLRPSSSPFCDKVRILGRVRCRGESHSPFCDRVRISVRIRVWVLRPARRDGRSYVGANHIRPSFTRQASQTPPRPWDHVAPKIPHHLEAGPQGRPSIRRGESHSPFIHEAGVADAAEALGSRGTQDSPTILRPARRAARSSVGANHIRPSFTRLASQTPPRPWDHGTTPYPQCGYWAPVPGLTPWALYGRASLRSGLYGWWIPGPQGSRPGLCMGGPPSPRLRRVRASLRSG